MTAQEQERPVGVVREGFHRLMPFQLKRSGSPDQSTGPDDGRTLEGHAAVFGQPTVIDSWEGRFTEEIAPGAFRKTFRDTRPVLMFDHGQHPLLGSLPIGVVEEVKEDDIGAFQRSRLSDNWLVQPVADAVRDGAIRGMSFRFSVVREEWRDEDDKLIRDDETLLRLLWDESTDYPRRLLRELKVPELGPVVFPAYTGTDVSLRSVDGATVIDLGEISRNKSSRVQLARALFHSASANLRGKASDSTPLSVEDAPASEAEDTPQTDEAAPVPVDTDNQTRDAAALAAEMRARLDRINRR